MCMHIGKILPPKDEVSTNVPHIPNYNFSSKKQNLAIIVHGTLVANFS